MLFNGVCLLRGVHAGRKFIRKHHADAGSIFESAELLQRLGLLQT